MIHALGTDEKLPTRPQRLPRLIGLAADYWDGRIGIDPVPDTAKWDAAHIPSDVSLSKVTVT
jgi:hypothetical protein